METQQVTADTLNAAYKAIAGICHTQGIPPTMDGRLVQWIRSHVTYRPETEFFIVFCVACEISQLEQQAKVKEAA